MEQSLQYSTMHRKNEAKQFLTHNEFLQELKLKDFNGEGAMERDKSERESKER